MTAFLAQDTLRGGVLMIERDDRLIAFTRTVALS